MDAIEENKNPYLTPEEILEKYPEVEQKLGWDKKSLGTFQARGLLDGYYNRNNRVAMIREASLISLIKFYNIEVEKRKYIL